QSGAVGSYEGYADGDDDGPGGHHGHRGHHGPPADAYGGESTGGDSAGQADVAPGGGWGASQGSTGAS
ncbi:MAG: PE family protein, partial [Actinomycetota bacterium]